MQQLSGQDASFLYFETPKAPMHIGSFLVYNPQTAPGSFVRFKDILAHVESRLHLSRVFRQRLVRVPFDLDHPYWIDDDAFDLEFHVRHIALPKPGDWRQLCIQAARLHARPLDLTRPLWEMYVIEGLDNVEGTPPGSFAVLTKTHHAIIDGASGAEIMAYLHDVEADPLDKPVAQPWKGEREPAAIELIMRSHFNNLTQPARLLETMQRSMPGMMRLGAGLGTQKIKPVGVVPRTRFNGKITGHRVNDGRSFAINDVKAIKNAVPGATINDAVLTLIGGALRRYLEAKGELPKDSMTAMAPVSVRATDQSGAAGNQVSGMLVALGTHIADPLERLSHVHGSAQNSKALTAAIGARTMTDYSQFIPSALAGLAARLCTEMGLSDYTTPMMNCVVTNVPGPQRPLYFAGAEAVKMVGLGPIYDGMALIHVVFSYCGEIAVSFTSCREILPDPDFYAECIQASFEELRGRAANT
jgi:diacylglycerol O-acyltransferase / wax synthase